IGGKTMIGSKRPIAPLALLLLSLVAALPAWGDGPQTSTIGGRVTDAQGQALPGVTVTLSGPQGEKSTVTDEDGRYRFGLLQAGAYTLAAKLEGMGSSEKSATLESGA